MTPSLKGETVKTTIAFALALTAAAAFAACTRDAQAMEVQQIEQQ